MATSQEELSKRLLYLPVDLHEKVLLWLTYRGLKPVSVISINRRNLNLLRRGIKTPNNDDGQKIKRIKKWIYNAGLFFEIEDGRSGSWFIGKDKDKVVFSAKNIRKFDFESEIKLGLLFGYPRESVETYAKNRTLRLGENPIAMVWPGHQSFHPELKEKYYLPYLTYALKADRVEKDSQTARVWADTMRKEVPILAKWFEKHDNERRNKEGRWNDKWVLTAKRDNQTVEQIITEYSMKATCPKEVLLIALQEFLNNILNDFQFASVCYELRKKIISIGQKDNLLHEILKEGEAVYDQKRNTKLEAIRARTIKLQKWFDQNKKESPSSSKSNPLIFSVPAEDNLTH